MLFWMIVLENCAWASSCRGANMLWGSPAQGFGARVQVLGTAVWMAVVENWLNWFPCLLLLAGPGLTIILCPGTAGAGLNKTR